MLNVDHITRYVCKVYWVIHFPRREIIGNAVCCKYDRSTLRGQNGLVIAIPVFVFIALIFVGKAIDKFGEINSVPLGIIAKKKPILGGIKYRLWKQEKW